MVSCLAIIYLETTNDVICPYIQYDPLKSNFMKNNSVSQLHQSIYQRYLHDSFTVGIYLIQIFYLRLLPPKLVREWKALFVEGMPLYPNAVSGFISLRLSANS